MDGNRIPRFYGKLTGHCPRAGELNPNVVINLLTKLKAISYQPVPPDYEKISQSIPKILPDRFQTFCPGCPHRASYWSILRAIKRNKNKGYVTGDVGCYSMGILYNSVVKTLHCMGAGPGLASGLGVLKKFGLDDPIITVIGDSTFYHACMPALVNILYNNSDVTICIFDNNATAMTGFQPHPGTGLTASGDEARIISIEDTVKGMGFQDVRVVDPYDIRKATEAVYESITSPGSHVIIFKRECMLIARRKMEKAGVKIKMFKVDTEKCAGEKCGICSRQFNCPACTWNLATNKAEIDSALCNGCGVCATICPYKAIREVG
jgi:indolepyruvate ferredoxin oxidoreductase alpha subunit